jgi:hypothetical protein
MRTITLCQDAYIREDPQKVRLQQAGPEHPLPKAREITIGYQPPDPVDY